MHIMRIQHLFNICLKSLALCVFVFVCAKSELYAQLKHVSSQMPVGNSTNEGYARFDREFYSLDLGNGSKIELFFKFSTEPSNIANGLGGYWSVPFFESTLVKENKSQYVWRSPNCGEYRFNKSAETPKGWTECYVSNARQDWILKIAKDGSILITKKDDEVLKYEIKDGRLISFCDGKGTDIFRINYNKSGFPVRLYNFSKRISVMELIYKENLLESIILPLEKKNITLGYGNYALWSVIGNAKDVAKPYLTSIKYLDGSEDKFAYEAMSQKSRKILLNGNEKQDSVKVAVNKIMQKREKSEAFIEWDAKNGIIVSDSGGEYAIRNPLIDDLHPDTNSGAYKSERTRGMRTQESGIAYKRPENKYDQMWLYNKRTAVKMLQDGSTGEQTRTSYIATTGSLSMKVRRIEKKITGEPDCKLYVSKAYNDKGELIREIDGLGNLKEFIYDKNGKHLKTLENANVIESYSYSDSGNLQEYIVHYNNTLFKTIVTDKSKEFYENDRLVRKEEYINGILKKVLLEINDKILIFNENDFDI